MYAAGKIPGSFFKREGRAGEKGTLTARMIDRPLRPLFPKGWRHETQLVSIPLSVDHVHPYDILAMNGASAALMISDIPFPTPVGAVRIGKDRRQLRRQPRRGGPAREHRPRPDRGRHRGGHPDGRGRRQRDHRGRDPRRARHRARRDQEALRAPARAAPRRPARRRWRSTPPQVDEALLAADQGLARRRRSTRPPRSRTSSSARTRPRRSRTEVARAATRGDPERRGLRRASAPPRSWRSTSSRRTIIRERIAVDKKRPDGRGADEIRDISIEVGVAPRTHGSALFTRGQTQALSASPRSARSRRRCVSTRSGLETKKHYFHHYNFPPFSVGEAGFMRGPKRRDIGHGALAERALRADGPVDRGLPVHDSRRLGHPRVQRLVVDGLGLRLLAVADGRRRADQGAGRRHRDGPDQGGRRLHRAHRHRRRRGSPRRHGLQGRRHRRGHHRPADGHQDHRRDVRHPARRARRRPRRPARSSSARWPRSIDGAARGALAVRAADHPRSRSTREDRPAHRQGRRDDPRPVGGVRVADRRQRRRARCSSTRPTAS